MSKYITAREMAWGMNLVSWMKLDGDKIVDCWRNNMIRKIIERKFEVDAEKMLELKSMFDNVRKITNT